MNKKVLWLLIALLGVSLIASYVGIEYYKKVLNTPTESKGNTLVGNDGDSYGCKASTGYTYDADIKACARSWELNEAKKHDAIYALKAVRNKQKLPETGIYIAGVRLYKCTGCSDVYVNTGDSKIMLIRMRQGVLLSIDYVNFSDIPADATSSGDDRIGTEPPVTTPVDPGEESYTCPSSGYIDCMPTVGGPRKDRCDQKYLTWAKEHCPNFEGVAY